MEIGAEGLRAHYDLIVVGTGPAGLTLAHRYEALTGNKVLLIESGRRSREEADTQEVHTVAATGDFPPAFYSRHSQRTFGGTSTIWSGWCAVLEERSFLNHEWPFSYGELYSYYPKAAEILSVPEAVHRRPEVAFRGNPNIVYRPFYVSPPVRFNESFRDWVDNNQNVDVLFNHTVIDIDLADATAESVFIRDSSDKQVSRFAVSGANIVLATGGIQNARLLQLALHQASTHAGQYFMEHPHVYGVASIILDREQFEYVKDKQTRSRVVHAIALSSEFSSQHSMSSATFEVDDTHVDQRNLLGRSTTSVVGNVTIRAEMEPVRSNRVSLSETRRDFVGAPLGEVNLSVDASRIRAVAGLLNNELVRSGIGRLSVLPEHLEMTGGGHMMGTTRMGHRPDSSVADAQGRVHGIANLYMAGSSLFPAGGAANPTLTIVALSLRLADHLAHGN